MAIFVFFRRRFFQFCIISLVLLWASTVAAQTWYVKPTAEIPLRRGQGSDYKILAIVSDGTPVTILEETESWAKVITEEGQEGWLLKRYLSAQKPLEKAYTALQKENSALEDKIFALEARMEELQAGKAALEATLENNRRELASTSKKYQNLVKDTANVVAIKESLEKSRDAVTKLQQKLGTVAAENKRLRASRNIKWFLAGGGTLIFGCIVGMISARSKKKKSSLY